MFGERDRAHDVLISSLPTEFSKSLAHRLDLPGQMPPGFTLENCVSGFRHHDRYVVARTSIDASASRQGMVFSHALVAELDEICDLADIAPVFSQLIAVRPEVLSIKKFNHAISGYSPVTKPIPEFYDMLATRTNCPVVVGNPLALEHLIRDLWPRLFRNMRSALQFRLSFGPEESDLSEFDVVAVPSITVTRWPRDRVMDPANRAKNPKTSVGKLLCGEFKEEAQAFLLDLSVDCNSFNTLGLISSALDLSTDKPTFTRTLATLRIISSLQPSPNKGLAIKKCLLQQLLNTPGPNHSKEFLSLRNFDLGPYQEKTLFHRKITAGFVRLFETETNRDQLFEILLSTTVCLSSTDAWRTACTDALRQISPIGAKNVAIPIWTLLLTGPENATCLLNKIAGIEVLDEAIAKCVDTSFQLSNSNLLDTLNSCEFTRTESAILISLNNDEIVGALTEACRRDQNQYGTKVIEHLTSKLNPTELVSAAIKIDNVLVTKTATVAVASTPTLLEFHTLRDPLVQKIWIEAMRLEPTAWRIKTTFTKLQNEIFDLLLSSELEPKILDLLISCPLMNVLDYPHRKNLWIILTGRSLDSCLTLTAESWIASLPDGLTQTGYLEPEEALASMLSSKKMSQKIKKALTNLTLEEVVNVYFGNPLLPDALLIEVSTILLSSDGRIASENLHQFALLLSTQTRPNVTLALLQRFGVTDQLHEFFSFCSDHISLWDRLRHGIGRATRSDLDSLLVDTVCELYPTGLKEREIWERAGGDLSQMDLSGNGQHQWQKAVSAIRKGNKVRRSALLKVLRRDFPDNKQLKYLNREIH